MDDINLEELLGSMPESANINFNSFEEVNHVSDNIETTQTETESSEIESTEQSSNETINAENLIAENSNTHLVDESTSRFSGADWFNIVKEQRVTLAGVGGIGSYVGFLLSRLHIQQMWVYDDDIVEEANMSGQLYGLNDISSYKVDALARFVATYSKYYNYFSMRQRFMNDCTPTNIMICGFDNMEARKTYFNAWIRLVKSLPINERNTCLFIDGRLSAESIQVFCLTGSDAYNITQYQQRYLFTDAQADSEICSYKQTSFCACMIGSLIVNLFVNFCYNLTANHLIDRDLPFFTSYEADRMFFKTIN